MGSGRVTFAVADAGPLIHLSEIGCLSLLDIFGAVHIPNAVWSETVQQGRVHGDDILTIGNIQRHTLSQAKVTLFVGANRLQNLHSGERECLYLCRQIGVPLLLTDDLAVREAAKRLGLTPVGSLGIVVRAYHMKHLSLPDAERHLADLHDVSSLFVTRAIVEIAIEQLRGRLEPG